MVDPLVLDAVSRPTRTRLVLLHMQTAPRVASLRDLARPIAGRRPGQRVSPAIHLEATSLLLAVRRVLSREPFPRDLLILRELPDWSTLLSRLELAMTGLAAFRTRYASWDDDLSEIVWHDQAWVSFRQRQAESPSEDSDFDEF